MPGVRLLSRFAISADGMRGRGGWRGGMLARPPAVMEGLTSTQACGGRHGAGRRSPLTKRVARGWAKDGPQSNNGMHPTAGTLLVINGNGAAAAGDAGR
jgi:hypothetical protein